ncbi:hypothetical protein [Chryseobacterium lathyri]|uniref:hypothetical protein n=1 Tax=Chryseobacterium lathyri TaxID=395933 RepID=UPI001CBCD296|nr:hypothetical protein [Chryseobacterium lathyri]
MNKDELAQILEILKASVPIFSIVAVVVAAFLNARFNRKQKERDELMSYKIKAYVSLCEVIAQTRQNYDALLSNISSGKVDRGTDSKSPEEAYQQFNKVLYKNMLFLSRFKKNKLYLLTAKLHLTAIQFNINASHIIYEKEDIIASYKEVISECDKVTDYLHMDLGFHQIDH